MKVSTMVRSALLVAVLLVAGSAASMAQGRSATVNGFGIHAGTHGAGIQDAVTPSIQLLGSLSLSATDGNTNWGFTPWLKFLLEGTVNPLFYAGLGIQSRSATVGTVTTTNTELSIGAGTGIQYYINPNVGFFGSIELINLGLSETNKVNSFGVMGGHVGVEWFFGP